MRLRRSLSGPLLAVLLVAPAGCGDDTAPATGDPAAGGTPGSSTVSSTPLEVRAVVATSAAPPPDSLVKQQFDALDCDAAQVPVPADEPGAVCDAEGTKYSLGPAVVVGGVEDATAGQTPDSGDTWVITVELEPGAGQALEELTTELAPVAGRVALVVDAVVLSAPAVGTPITDGLLQVAGAYDEETATALAEAISRG